jgi:CTP-dependent riboflavin kinase
MGILSENSKKEYSKSVTEQGASYSVNEMYKLILKKEKKEMYKILPMHTNICVCGVALS